MYISPIVDGSVKYIPTFVAKQRLGKNFAAAKNTQAKIE
jgi:hypothetical protein